MKSLHRNITWMQLLTKYKKGLKQIKNLRESKIVCFLKTIEMAST